MTETTVDCSKLKKPALIAAVVGLALSAVGYVTNHAQFAQSWLIGWNFWFLIASGSLGWLMIHHMVSGRWGFVIQRPLEAAARTIPFMLVLFVPVLLSMHELYEWTHEEAIAHDHLIQAKLPYLNAPGFMIRFGVYAVIWIFLAYRLSALSRKLDQGPDEAVVKKMRAIAAPGLVLYALAMSFASFDWMMSLEPHWFSSIYGALYMVAGGLSTLLFMILVLRRVPPLRAVATAQQSHDLGNLTFAFTVLWAYMTFGQFLIIWSGNLYEETFWYLDRAAGGWLVVSWILFGFGFILPFFLLLIRNNKRQLNLLATIALGMIAVRYVDVYWQVAPTFRDHPAALSWMDLAAWVGVGGTFLYLFARQLEKMKPLNQDHRFADFIAGGKEGH